MPTLISEDLVITGTYSLSENTQIGPNARVTVKPGAVLDLGRYQLENFGTLSLEGNSIDFAVIKNGRLISTGNVERLYSNFGLWEEIDYVGRNSIWYKADLGKSLIEIKNSVILDSNVFAQQGSISDSVFSGGSLKGGDGTYGVTLLVERVTFKDSRYVQDAWSPSDWENEIRDSNFLGDSPVIRFQSGSTGAVINLKIENTYVAIPTGKSFEDMVYDADDDFSIPEDLDIKDFRESPITNSSDGFLVGTYLISVAELSGSESSSSVTSTVESEVTVIVNRGVLSPEPVYLTNLKESVSYSGGTVLSTFVEYGGLSFDFEAIDSLVTVVLRNGEFTSEFRSEIVAFAPSASNLTYSDAVLLVGESQIEARLIAIAGADGNYVG